MAPNLWKQYLVPNKRKALALDTELQLGTCCTKRVPKPVRRPPMSQLAQTMEMHLGSFRMVWAAFAKRLGRHPAVRFLGCNFYLLDYSLVKAGLIAVPLGPLTLVQGPMLRKEPDRHNPSSPAPSSDASGRFIKAMYLLDDALHIIRSYSPDEALAELKAYIDAIWQTTAILNREARQLKNEVLVQPPQRIYIDSNGCFIGYGRKDKHISVISFFQMDKEFTLNVFDSAETINIDILPPLADSFLPPSEPYLPLHALLGQTQILDGVLIDSLCYKNLKIVLWNVRGMFNVAFNDMANELVSLHNPTILVVTETWVDYTMSLYQLHGLGLAGVRLTPGGNGRAGALFCFNPTMVKVNDHSCCGKLLHLTVKDT